MGRPSGATGPGVTGPADIRFFSTLVVVVHKQLMDDPQSVTRPVDHMSPCPNSFEPYQPVGGGGTVTLLRVRVGGGETRVGT